MIGWKAELPWEPSVILSPAFGRVGVRSPAALLPSADRPASTSTAAGRGVRDEVQTLPLRFTTVEATARCTFVCAGDVRVVGSGVSDALGGVRDGAGLSLRQFGGRGQRNVVVHESVPVKLYVHHLEGWQLGVTETLRKKTFINSNLQSLLRASAAPCTFCPAVGQGKKKICCFAAVN